MSLAHGLCVLLLAALPSAEIPPAVWTQFDNVAHQLAKGGRERECKALLEVLEQLGMQKAPFAKLQGACLAEISKAAHAAESLPDAAKRLKQVSRQLAPLLTNSAAEEKQRLARLLLRLDDSLDEAHAALGHVRVGSSWTSPEEQKSRQRRGEILEAIDKASQLVPEIESGPSTDPLLVELNGGPGSFARYGGLTLQSCLTEERTKRVLVEELRAGALSLYLRDKPLALPKKGAVIGGAWFYLLDQQGKYLKAIDLAKQAGDVTPELATRFRDLGGFQDQRGRKYLFSAFESTLEASLFCELSNNYPGPHVTSVMAGHLNWVCLALLGVSMPQYVVRNKQSDAPQGGTHVNNPADRALRDERFLLAKAGILGCRSWVAFLAERNEDPKWENSFVDQLGKVTGEDLLKATTVAEYMQELGTLRALLVKLGAADPDKKTYAVMSEALGMPVTEFEARWRAWIVPARGGLAQVLDKAQNRSFSAEGLAALARLNQIRKKTFEGRVSGIADVKLEREISDGAQRHAEYLAQNPEQADKWPEAHEEYRDKPGYTPEGHWSGNHSNVVSGLQDPKEAVDGWIGTFYHRLPMLTPELLRIGWGLQDQMAVLDVNSFVTPPESDWMVLFPYDGMVDVPVHFQGHEHPNPVPEEPEQDFGYPITLQLGQTSRDQPSPEITLRLFEGKTEVPCWFSSPSKPTNPQLVPANAWCLIPKGPLKSGASYTVSAEWYSGGKKVDWSFRTGS
jgi:uncharacterized protein YkwD